jgi:hypothetical protein
MTEANVRIHEMLEESGVSGTDPELLELLAGLEQQYVDIAVPEPGPQLATLLGGGVTGSSMVRPLLGGRRRVVAAGALALGAVLTTGVAAANELPPPAQRWIAEFSERFLPFDLPGPEDKAYGAGEHRRDADDRDPFDSRAHSGEDRDDQPPAETPDQASGSSLPKVSGHSQSQESSNDSDESRSDGRDSDARDDAAKGDREWTGEERAVRSDSDEVSEAGTGKASDDGGSAPKASGETTSADESGDSEDSEESGDVQSTEAGDAEGSHDTEESRDR